MTFPGIRSLARELNAIVMGVAFTGLQYDLKKLKRRAGTPKFDPEAAKMPISIRLDGSVRRTAARAW
jgi:hypothetical protein